MHGIASASNPCRRSWMTTLSACGWDLVMIQVWGTANSVADGSSEVGPRPGAGAAVTEL
jgi:hypothetical protein